MVRPSSELHREVFGQVEAYALSKKASSMSTARRKAVSTLLRSAALSVAAAVSSSPRRYSTTLQGLGGTGLGGTGYTRARGVHGAVCTAQAVQDLDSRPGGGCRCMRPAEEGSQGSTLCRVGNGRGAASAPSQSTHLLRVRVRARVRVRVSSPCAAAGARHCPRHPRRRRRAPPPPPPAGRRRPVPPAPHAAPRRPGEGVGSR